MKYYLGEIYVTKRKVLWWWIDYTERFSSTLIEAPDFLTAREKCKAWHDERSEGIKAKYITTYFVTPAI